MSGFIVFGAGSPLEIEAYSPEVAEAEVVERYGVKIENLVTMRQENVVLHRGGDSDEVESDGLHSDPE
jgi:hypothetical protein